ncbi:MAG: ClcB-like voltage-gated chloride channel protein [Opitutaceae bacterium]
MTGEGSQIGAISPAAASTLRRLQLGLRLLSRLRPTDREIIFLWAILVGLLGAAAALGFQALTGYIQLFLTGHQGRYVEIFYQLSPWQRIAVPAVGALCAGLILTLSHRFVRSRATDYMEAVSLGDGTVPIQASLIRSGSALFSIASGGSIGREGPLVQLAGLAASIVGRFRGMAPPKRRLLVACGASAGMAAAYHTPLGGAFFVAEIVLGSFAMESLGPLLISSAVAAIVVDNFSVNESLFHFEGGAPGSMGEYVLYPFLGILCGLIAAFWMQLLKESRYRFGALPIPLWLRMTFGGLIVGLLAFWHPEVTGNGSSVIHNMLNNEYAIHFIALVLLLKILATCAVFGSGAVGGIFTPTLLVGAASGFLFARFAGMIWPGDSLESATFALAGMSSLLAASAQAPITAIIMLFEMSLRYDLILPLAIASVSAYSTVKALGTDSVYKESLHSGPRSVFDKSLAEVRVTDILRPSVAKVSLNAPFRDIARAFLTGSGRELWVIGSDDRLLGEILLPDVEPYLREEGLAQTVIASDLMHENSPRLLPSMGLPLALESFSRTIAESLPVVDPGSGKLLGSIARSDLFLTLAELTRRERTRTA